MPAVEKLPTHILCMWDLQGWTLAPQGRRHPRRATCLSYFTGAAHRWCHSMTKSHYLFMWQEIQGYEKPRPCLSQCSVLRNCPPSSILWLMPGTKISLSGVPMWLSPSWPHPTESMVICPKMVGFMVSWPCLHQYCFTIMNALHLSQLLLQHLTGTKLPGLSSFSLPPWTHLSLNPSFLTYWWSISCHLLEGWVNIRTKTKTFLNFADSVYLLSKETVIADVPANILGQESIISIKIRT